MKNTCLAVIFCSCTLGQTSLPVSANPVPESTASKYQRQIQTPEEKFAGEIASVTLAQQMAMSSHQGAWSQAKIDAIRKLWLDLAGHYPRKADPLVGLADFLAQIDHREEAMQEFQVAGKLAPERADILAAQANLILTTGNTVEATRLMEAAVGKTPNDPALHYALANLYFLFRQDLFPVRHSTEDAFFDLAMEQYRRAAELAPHDLNYARTYAETFYTIPHPDWNVALAAWSKVLALSSDPSYVQSHLTRVQIHLKNKTAAQRSLALITDPGFIHTKESLQRQIDRL